MAIKAWMSPVTGWIAEWQNWGKQGVTPSKGVLLRRIDVLIADIARHRSDLDEGKVVFPGNLQALQQAAQYCLADLGESVRPELAEIVSLDFLSAPEGLAKFKPFVDGKWSPPDDPGYRRLQDEYDAKVKREAERFEHTLRRAKDKALGIGPESIHGAIRVRPFPTPNGTTWADVTIRFTSDLQSQISARDHTEVRNYVEMGFEDRRGRRQTKPDRNWETLRNFSTANGVIASTKDAEDWPKLEKAVQTVNKRLRSLFGLPDPPIIYDRTAKAYRTGFKILPPPDDVQKETQL